MKSIKILPAITVKKIGVLGGEYIILRDEEMEEYIQFFPDKENSIVLFDTIEIEGKEYLLATNGVLIALENLSYVDIRLLLEDEQAFLTKKLKEKRQYHEKATKETSPSL